MNAHIYGDKSDLPVVNIPHNVYCTDCQVLMLKGSVGLKFDAATYFHVSCNPSRMRHFAAHKQPNTGMDVSPR